MSHSCAKRRLKARMRPARSVTRMPSAVDSSVACSSASSASRSVAGAACSLRSCSITRIVRRLASAAPAAARCGASPARSRPSGGAPRCRIRCRPARPAADLAPERQVLRRARSAMQRRRPRSATSLDAQQRCAPAPLAATTRSAVGLDQPAGVARHVRSISRPPGRSAGQRPGSARAVTRRSPAVACVGRLRRLEEVGDALARRQVLQRVGRQLLRPAGCGGCRGRRACSRSSAAPRRAGTAGSCTSTRGFSGRVELTPITIAQRSSVSCTTEPGGYTPIMRMKAPSIAASNWCLPCANSSDSASCGVSACAGTAGLHRLS